MSLNLTYSDADALPQTFPIFPLTKALPAAARDSCR